MGLNSNLKNALFQSYFKILSRQLKINSLYIILLAYEAIQMNTMITFNIHYNFNSSNQTLENSETNTNGLLAILKTMLTFNSSTNNYLVSIAFIYTFLSIMILLLSTVVYNFFNNINYKEPKQFLSTLFLSFNFIYKVLSSKVLIIPLLNICLSMFECSTDATTGISFLKNYSINETCTGLHYSINLVVSILLIILVIIDYSISCILLNETKPTSKVPWASRSNNSEYVLLLMKMILCVFYVFDFGIIGTHIKVFVVFVTAAILVVFRFLNIVMLNYYSYLAITVFEGSFLFNATIAIVNKYMSMQLFIETLAIQFLASVFFGLLIFNIIDKLHQTIINMDTESITSEAEAYSHIFLLTELARRCKNSVYQKSVFLGIFQKHRLKCENATCKCSDYTSVLNPEIWERRTLSSVIEHEFEVKTYLVSYFEGNKPKPDADSNHLIDDQQSENVKIPSVSFICIYCIAKML